MKIIVRYFVLSHDMKEPEIIECNEQTFLRHGGAIQYERHTIRENGANQICLTKI